LNWIFDVNLSKQLSKSDEPLIDNERSPKILPLSIEGLCADIIEEKKNHEIF
jgi:hypothetical protein